MRRVPVRELLDEDAGTPSEVKKSLEDVRFLNEYFGGVSTTMAMIRRVARKTGAAEFSMLDVAAGAGDVPELVRVRVEPHGVRLKLTLLDRLSSHLGAGDNRIVGDARALPFQERSFDLVSCCLFVHHLAPSEVNVFVKEALRCARTAVLINDLVRHPFSYAVAYAGRFIYKSRITTHDAPASVRQSYTLDEMREMLEQAGAATVEISRQYFYRMAAIAWKTQPRG